MTSVKIIVIPKSARLNVRAKKSLECGDKYVKGFIKCKFFNNRSENIESNIYTMLLSLFDLGCILSLWPKMTLKKRKRKFGDIERIESQLFQKVWVQEDSQAQSIVLVKPALSQSLGASHSKAGKSSRP